MIKVYDAIRNAGLKSRLILQIHDELVINTYPDEQETIEKLIVDNMESAYKLAVELKADLNEGKNWYELK
jgi:DNA polymerase-1